MLNCNTEIRFLKGVGEKRAEILKDMGIDTVGALLRFFPRAYEDFGKITKISDAFYNEKICVKAKVVTEVSEQYVRKNMTIYRFDVKDETSFMTVTIFNNKYLAKKINKGSTYLFLGKLNEGRYHPAMSSPEIREELNDGIAPIYSANAKLSSSAIEKLVKTALLSVDSIPETLPESIIRQNNLSSLKFAIENIHFPKSNESFERAKHRLVFEELFVLQTGLMLLKGKKKRRAKYLIENGFENEFYSLLPYTLTNAQKRCIAEALSDMKSGVIMNRLVQGDVGSGKTMVAAAVMYACAKNKIQSAMMAPTEILARQHYENLKNIFKDTDINICLITGSTPKAQRKRLTESIKNGETDIVIGTHALLSDDTEYLSLGLVVTDEQHRFGVAQRAKLAAKGIHTHTLVMSATPIPRTLGLVIYGDLDISIIDEYPKGRQKIESFAVDSSYRSRVYNYVKKHIAAHLQGYIVCPLVEGSELLEKTAATEYFETLQNGAFKGYKLGLLHGKLSPKEKDRVMTAFKEKKIDLLVCTTVIEVGIDVPNAAIMVIEDAERFGLSQLHQLRGRIGRGSAKSTCIFISDAKGDIARERLKVITDSADGFKIAEQDLRLRGPGDFLGNRQHGLPQLKIADIFANGAVLKQAQMAAANILEKDANLSKEENLMLRQEILNLYKSLNEN